MDKAAKHDSGKARYDLIPIEAEEKVADVLTFGTKKYDAHNWRKGLSYSRLYSASRRHLKAFWQGEKLDPESGLPHLAHAIVNELFMLQFELEGRKELDDRYVKQGDKGVVGEAIPRENAGGTPLFESHPEVARERTSAFILAVQNGGDPRKALDDLLKPIPEITQSTSNNGE